MNKRFKQTEIGEIPKEWEVVKLGELSSSIASGKSKTQSENGEFIIYGSTGAIGSKLKPDYEGLRILIARVGANAGTVNKVKGKYCVSDNTLMVQLKNEIDFNYIFYYLNYSNLNQLVFGSGQPLITGTQLKSLTIPLPSLAEQTAIATVLSDMDALLTQTENYLEKKKAIKQGLMQHLLMPKTGWTYEPLEKFVKINSGESPTQQTFVDDGMPYFKVEQLNNSNKYAFESIYQIKGLHKISKGSILFPKRGASIFLNKIRILKVDSYMDTNLMTLTVNDELNNEYLFYQLTSIGLDSIADTTSIPQINNKHIYPFVIPLPPTMEEQIRIAEILTDADQEIQALEHKIEKLKQQKQGMMQALLTGKIRLQ